MTIIEVITEEPQTIVEVITEQPLTPVEINSFRSVPVGINLTTSGDGDSYLSDDGTYKSISASSTNSVIGQYTASEAIGGHIVVYQTAGGVAIASSDSTSHANRILGITNSAVSLGANVPVTLSGELTEPTWTFTEGLPVYLSVNGTLTQTPPTSGFILQMGVAVSPTKISVSIKLPIIL